jgi:hypothetical protein
MTTKKSTEIVSEIVELLTPIESAERIRVVQASLTLLGETFAGGSRHVDGGGDTLGEGDGELSALPVRARTWMKQNSVTVDELQQVFHLADGNADVIAGEVPGKNKKEKTYNAYVLAGLARLLSAGDGAFDDKSARSLCETFGCYDQANHSSTIKNKGNEFTGTKDKGWTLTAPGLKRAAALVKEITKS